MAHLGGGGQSGGAGGGGLTPAQAAAVAGAFPFAGPGAHMLGLGAFPGLSAQLAAASQAGQLNGFGPRKVEQQMKVRAPQKYCIRPPRWLEDSLATPGY